MMADLGPENLRRQRTAHEDRRSNSSCILADWLSSDSGHEPPSSANREM